MDKLKDDCLLLKNISSSDIKLIEENFVLRKFRKKEIILREGNENNYLFIVKAGVVRVDAYSNNKRQTLSFLKEGDFFGEIALFTDSSTSANVVSVINSEIYTLKKEDLNNLIEQIPQLSKNIIKYLSNRVRSADKVIFDYAFKMLEARVASKLLGLMEMFKGKDKNNFFINLPITHQDLADYVGTSRETITKILSKFKDIGAIDIQTKKIEIIDKVKLESFIGE